MHTLQLSSKLSLSSYCAVSPSYTLGRAMEVGQWNIKTAQTTPSFPGFLRIQMPSLSVSGQVLQETDVEVKVD